MGRGEFDPGTSRITHGDIHANDSFIYRWIGTNAGWSHFNSLGKSIFNFLRVVTRITEVTSGTIKFAARNHILVSWTLGNLSYQTAITFRNHRKWIWWIEHTGLPNAWKAGKGYVLARVAEAEKSTARLVKYAIATSKSYAYKLHQDLLRKLNQDVIALEALAKSYYERNRVYIGQVLQQAQNDIQAAYNNAIAYTNNVRKQMIQYTNKALQESETYTDKAAANAENSAVHKADAFTIAAIAALVTGIIAEMLAQQAELAAAEAVDAAWITGEGALLESQLGLFGHDLSALLSAAVMGALIAYLIQGVRDPIGWADETSTVLSVTVDPIFDSIVSAVGVVT